MLGPGVKDLDGDKVVALQVPGLPDLALPSSAQQLDKLITSDLVAAAGSILSRLELCDGCRSPHNSQRLDRVHRGTDTMINPTTIAPIRRWLPALLMLVLVPTARAVDGPTVPNLDHDVQPLLKSRCIKCHGPNKPKAKLNLSGPRSLARGGESGPIVEPGSPEESALWDRVAANEMPPKPEEPLSGAEKALIRRWIEQGAKGLPRSEDLQGSPPGADHWAFGRMVIPVLPVPRDSSRVRTPVDRFIQVTLEERGLALGAEADRATLIRRLSFDLTGLPPTPEEITAFLADGRPDAHERLIERLLTSPRHGERWGKYWLDAAGYSESNGYFSADSDRPLAYRYRDYVIRAFNADKPLDQIVREQLAGDELSGYKPGIEVNPTIIDQLIATHFLRNGQDGTGESDGNPDEVRADKVAVLDSAVQIIGSSLLGFTLQCAKCHDHKFEPVTQKEYYQLHAILAPAYRIEKWLNPDHRFVDAAPRPIEVRWQAHERIIDTVVTRLTKQFGPWPNDPPPEKAAKKKSLDKLTESANAMRLPYPGRIAWVADLGPEAVSAPLFIRGNPSTPGPLLGPGVPEFLTDLDNPYEVRRPNPEGRSTGRRLALARWLTRPGSRPAALLARVLANRIWQHHFGTGLAATSDNLGYTGSPPSHPALLEYLAGELVRSGWSSRALHRLILNSAVWRQSSAPRPEAQAIDPDNRLLARFPLRRLDAEAIRDAMLMASGELDESEGGPAVPTRRTDVGEVVPVEPACAGLRRSVYLQQRRTQVTSLLEVFDAPSIVTTCTRRLPATVPLQSLSLLNSGFVVDRAAALAARLERECPREDDPDARLERGFLLIIGRPPASLERDAACRFLQTQPARYPGMATRDARRRAWADCCQMVLASNSFLYVE
jgi:Protein of unknown function (DUF1553)/Protein of unknown function (DUF1549)/Planctomycete cytochrome C